MTPTEVEAKLNQFLSLPAETEWIEFKEAKTSHDLKSALTFIVESVNLDPNMVSG